MHHNNHSIGEDVMIQIISIGERGLVVSFSKHDILAIKDGGTLHGELVGPNGKTKIMFMRDNTFNELKRKFDKSVADGAAKEAAKRQVDGAVEESQALGQVIGLADKAEEQKA